MKTSVDDPSYPFILNLESRQDNYPTQFIPSSFSIILSRSLSHLQFLMVDLPSDITAYFDHLPDSLLVIFNKIGDVRALGRCCLVSKRFQTIVPQVQNVVVRVDCVISNDDDVSSVSGTLEESRGLISSFFSIVVSGIVKPIQALGQFLGSSSSNNSNNNIHLDQDNVAAGGGGDVSHHSPIKVLKNFNEIRFLKIELPSGELGIENNVLLKWRADFGSTLDNCLIIGASSVENCDSGNRINNEENDDDNGNIPDSFYIDGGLKLRVVWTISSLIAASARHYLLQPIIAEHTTLDLLVLSDADGQGVLCMTREQLEELRVKPLSASSASKRTLVPALNMGLWYAPYLDLPDGTVLKGATLVAIRPTHQVDHKEIYDGSSLVSSSFEEPYATAARMLVKRRTYSLEMNSF